MDIFVTHYASPIGILRISGTTEGVTGVVFLEGWEEHRGSLRERTMCPSALRECSQQLQEYFSGKRKDLRTLRITPIGTEFQRCIWQTLLKVPWGESMTYAEIGKRLGYHLAAQAVGTAVARNPLAVLIPCHRVVPAAGGEIGEYAWGSWRKRWLLRHEGRDTETHSRRQTALVCPTIPKLVGLHSRSLASREQKGESITSPGLE